MRQIISGKIAAANDIKAAIISCNEDFMLPFLETGSDVV